MPNFPPILKRPLPVVGKLARDDRGATAIMLAIALSSIVGFAGLGSEVAGWYYTTRAMQGAASSAAASAAAELAAATVGGSSISNDQLQHTGKAVSATFSFTDGVSNTTVTVNHPPTTTTGLNSSSCDSRLSGFNCYVEVVISQPQTALLSALFMSIGPTITSRAVALANTAAADTGCVIALDRKASRALQSSGSGNLTFTACSLYDNSNASDGLYVGGSGSITAQSAYVVGNVNGSVSTTGGTHTGVNPTLDPYANVAVPTSSTNCNGWNGNGNSSLHVTTNNSPAILSPATAGGTCALPNDVKVDAGATVVFCPGVYVFNSGGSLLMQGSSTLLAPPTATTNPAISAACVGDLTGGVTIVFSNTGGSSPGVANIGGGATVNLTAPTTGATAGIALFQSRTGCTGNGNNNNGCTTQLQGGGTQNITGAIYFPNNAVQYAGGSSTGSQCTQLIADTISFTGGATFNSNCTGTGTQTINYTNGTLVM